MNCLKSLTAAWVCIFFSCWVDAQDKICLENEVRQGKVADISLSTVRYTLPERPDQPLLLPLQRVLILLNSEGDYLVPSQMDSANPNIRALLSRFFVPGAHSRTKDQVFTLQHTMLEVKIDREDAENIYWGDNGRFFKRDIAAVIYSDGRSKILCPMDEAAKILGTCQQTPLNLGIGLDLVVSNAPGAVESGPTEQGNERVTAIAQDSMVKSRVNTLLAGVSRKEFEEKAEKKTAQFTDYLKILCDKSAGYEALDKAVSQAMTLFVNEDAVVEVSSNNRNSVLQLKIRDYLRKVKQVQYDKIDVKWTHVQYVSDLKPGPDGNLYGTVSFEQEFRGYRDGKLVYSDVTLKHANVVLKTYNKTVEGSNRKIWDVLLSDVGVVATKSM